MTQQSQEQKPYPSNPGDRDEEAAKPPALSGAMPATFIRNVSNELHTPITVLKGYAELLYEGGFGELAPEQQEALFVIVNRAEELNTMVSRIGTLMDVQSQLASPEQMNLSAMVAQMVEGQRERAADMGIVLSAHLAPDTPSIVADMDHIKAAMESLVENALKFTPNGGQVDVAVEPEGEWVCFSVTDTGIGIEENDLAQLFRSFHRLEGEATQHYGGLGLGLTLVKYVIEAYNGKMEIQSKPGEGSRFTMKFPAVSRNVPGDEAPTGAQTRRILVVDDEEFVTFTLKEGLEKLPNCSVVVTMSGAEAVHLFEERPFDLLITDYKMPDMNGVELAAYIREHYPDTGIIMVTAYSNHLLQEPSATAPIQRILNKPVRLAEIRTAALETLSEEFRAKYAQ